MHVKESSNILGLYPLDVSRPLPVVTIKSISRYFRMSPGGQNHQGLRTIGENLVERHACYTCGLGAISQDLYIAVLNHCLENSSGPQHWACRGSTVRGVERRAQLPSKGHRADEVLGRERGPGVSFRLSLPFPVSFSPTSHPLICDSVPQNHPECV